MTLELSHQPMHPIFTPWCAGTSRHERLLHVPEIRDRLSLIRHSRHPFVRPPNRHSGRRPESRRGGEG